MDYNDDVEENVDKEEEDNLNRNVEDHDNQDAILFLTYACLSDRFKLSSATWSNMIRHIPDGICQFWSLVTTIHMVVDLHSKERAPIIIHNHYCFICAKINTWYSSYTVSIKILFILLVLSVNILSSVIWYLSNVRLGILYLVNIKKEEIQRKMLVSKYKLICDSM